MPEISTIQSAYGFLAPLAAHTAKGTTPNYSDLATAIPTTTKPSAGLLYQDNPKGPNLIVVIPFADSVTSQSAIGMRLIGWSSLNQSSSVLWIPTVLFDSTLISVTGGAVQRSVGGSNVYFMNSIVQIAGQPTANSYHPAGGTLTTGCVDLASCVVDCIGSEIVTAQFKSASSGTVANMGCLWRTI